MIEKYHLYIKWNFASFICIIFNIVSSIKILQSYCYGCKLQYQIEFKS